MAETKRHKVFISFQHGCEDSYHPCGRQYYQTLQGIGTSFKSCIGRCGRNKQYPYIQDSNCIYYYKCGIYWKERFEYLMVDKTDKVVTKAVGDGDIRTDIATETIRQKVRDEFISDATVTVVLIGPETWKRKHVDWEISSSIKDTEYNSRCGLLGILLPTYPLYSQRKYNPYTIPPRLYNNLQTGFAGIYLWSEDPVQVQDWIHEAYQKRYTNPIDNSYPMFSNNRATNQTQWQP